MGTPISSMLIEILLHKQERIALMGHHPKCWTKYDDGNFIIINRDMNRVSPDNQFTLEQEATHKLPKLVGGSLTIIENRKGTYVNSILSFESYLPVSHHIIFMFP